MAPGKKITKNKHQKSKVTASTQTSRVVILSEDAQQDEEESDENIKGSSNLMKQIEIFNPVTSKMNLIFLCLHKGCGLKFENKKQIN